MAIHNLQAVAVSSTIQPYFRDDKKPGHYADSGTTFARLNLAKFTKPRGIYNKELLSLTKHLPRGSYIAGSFAASLLSHTHKPTDIDVFFSSGETFLDAFDMLNNPPDEDTAWALKGYKPDVNKEDLLARSKEIRVVNFKHEDSDRLPIQLIKMVWYDSAEEVIDSFDFTVTQFCVDGEDLVFNPASMADLLNENLIIHRHQFPMESLYRLVKYAKKGYCISPRTLQKIVEDIRTAKEMDPPLPFNMY